MGEERTSNAHGGGREAEKKRGRETALTKVWRRLFLDEKVCLGKQNPQYTVVDAPNYLRTSQTTLSKTSIISLAQFHSAGRS
jgi:hypothetical protein